MLSALQRGEYQAAMFPNGQQQKVIPELFR